MDMSLRRLLNIVLIHEKLSLNPNFDMVVLYSFLIRHLSYVYHLKGNLPQVTMLYTTHMSLYCIFLNTLS